MPEPTPTPAATDAPSAPGVPVVADAPPADATPSADAAAPSADATVASTEAPDASAAVATAADAAARLGGDYAPIVAIILAAVAVLGGKKAWDYYSERAAQKHALAVKELELRAQAQGLNGAQPPPCQAAQAKIEAEIAEIKGRLGAVEKKSASLSADFDGEEIERNMKKLTRAVKALQEERT